MSQGIRVVIYPVKDLAQAKALYRTLLGVEPYTDEGYYVGFRIGDQELGLDPYGHTKGMTGPVGCWRAGTARGSRCRWGEADCIGQRRRREHYQDSPVTVMAPRRRTTASLLLTGSLKQGLL